MAEDEQPTWTFVPGNDLARQAVALVLTSGNLKQVRRQNPLAGGQRQERTAEHRWHVAFATVRFHSFTTEQVDFGRAIQRAMARLLGAYPAQVRGAVETAWTEYGYETIPEGRYAMAVNPLLPIFLNNRASLKSFWARHHVSAKAVPERVRKIQESLPLIAARVLEVIDHRSKKASWGGREMR